MSEDQYYEFQAIDRPLTEKEMDVPPTCTGCERIRCLDHQECRADAASGRAFCADTCDGFRCPSGARCKLEPVLCITQPCPPVATCVSSPVCDLDRDPGPCVGALPRWYFDDVTGACEPFIYGGCGGNGNNFPSQETCEETCRSRP